MDPSLALFLLSNSYAAPPHDHSSIAQPVTNIPPTTTPHTIMDPT
jgi:hypothetical protein